MTLSVKGSVFVQRLGEERIAVPVPTVGRTSKRFVKEISSDRRKD